MTTIMTEEKLLNRLENIRYCLSEIKEYEMPNVVFINLTSFICYLNDLPSIKEYNLQTLLSEVEPYIPLTISDENLGLFLNAALENNEAMLKSLEASFIQNSTSNFINAVYNAKNEEAWNEIIKVCTQIRSYKENGRLIIE